jgi:hypothetical protein
MDDVVFPAPLSSLQPGNYQAQAVRIDVSRLDNVADPGRRILRKRSSMPWTHHHPVQRNRSPLINGADMLVSSENNPES